MNMKKILIGLGITAVILIFILVFVRKQKAKEVTAQPNDSKPNDSGSSGSGNSNGSSSNTTLDKNKLLKVSVTGEEVKELQRWINEKIQIAQNRNTTGMTATELATNYAIAILTPLTVDGQFGSGTENALDVITREKSIRLKDLHLYSFD